jgi:putative ABC transport system ATP-binding protein
MEIVKVENLSKTYGKGEASVEALKGVSFSVETGQFISIMGASGSGKSTLLHLLGGLDTPTNGKVTIDDRDIYSLKENDLSVFRRRKIGFIFQQYNLIPILSVRENITLPLLFDNREIDNEYIDEIMELLGISEKKNFLPTALSGGQQQRVAIARALATKPSIILADEPTGNLDTKTTEEVMSLLNLSIRKYHQTIVMITHNEKIVGNSDRIMIMEDGIIKSDTKKS